MTKPLLSVIIPTYRRTHELQRAIRSVLALNLPDIELIVVDDSSAETTELALGEFDKQHYTLLHNRENKGVSATRNHGASKAGGTWLWFLDSDDEIIPGNMRDIESKLHDDGAGIVYFHAESRDADGTSRIFESQFLPASFSRMDLLKVQNRPFTQSQLIVRKSKFERIGGFDETLNFGEDLDLWVRLIDADAAVANLPKTCVVKHEGSVHSLSDKIAYSYDCSCRIWRKHEAILRPQLRKADFWAWQYRQLETRYHVLCGSSRCIRGLRWSQRLNFCWRWLKLVASASAGDRQQTAKSFQRAASSMLSGQPRTKY